MLSKKEPDVDIDSHLSLVLWKNPLLGFLGLFVETMSYFAVAMEIGSKSLGGAAVVVLEDLFMTGR
jgi:hypothetical protein